MQARAAHVLIAAGLAGLTLGATLPAWAGDKGVFKGHAVLIDTKGMEQKTGEGHPYKVLWMGEQEGAIDLATGSGMRSLMAQYPDRSEGSGQPDAGLPAG